MMDLGSSICTPRNPQCLLCPLSADCAARAEGRQDAYPVKAAKKAKALRRGIAWWIEQDGAVLLVRRPAKGLLGGMRALPSSAWIVADPIEETPPVAADWQACGQVSHIFTHFALDLSVLRADLAQRPPIEGEWWPVADIATAGLPTLFARAAERTIAAREAE
jgi:A/G-specific adenine glycosylase